MSKKAPAKDAMRRIRNIGVIAHIDAGKTTLTERMLYYAHRIHRMGEVHEGLATMDYLPEEQERGITIVSACATVEWRDCQFNIIDTPGHVDFTIEVDRALRVLDGAVGVFDAVAGVEPQSETVWRQSERRRAPKLAFVNKMDRPGADFRAVLDQMRRKLGVRPLPVTVPLGEGPDFSGVVDVVAMRKLVFDAASQGERYAVLELSEEERQDVAEWREALLDIVCGEDDDLLARYLAGDPLPEDRLRAVIRDLVLSLKATPVLAGSALRNIGVQPLMDAVSDYLPSPADLPDAAGQDPATREPRLVPPSPEAPLTALAFKILMEGSRRFVLARLYAGRLTEGQEIWNPRLGASERAGKLYRPLAGRREPVSSVSAGEIVLLAGLRQVRTGDTLCAAQAPVMLEAIDEYRPVVSLAVEAKSGEQTDRMGEALEKFLQEDPTLFLKRDEETGQTILSGMGELHLEVALQRLKREWGVEPRVGRPQVACQETVAAEAVGEGEFDRLLGGESHYGRVRAAVEPLPRGSGVQALSLVDQASIRPEFIRAAEEGAVDALNAGLQGHPVQDVRVRILELGLKDGGGTGPGFRMAAGFAVKAALTEAGTVLLEPIMALEISAPDDFVGEVVGLLGAKGARIENLFDRSGHKVVQALAAMSRLFGFATELRSATQGRAGLSMRFERFDALP